MDALKLFDDAVIWEELQEKQRDKLSVEDSPTLADSHIVEIVFTGLAFDITQIAW